MATRTEVLQEVVIKFAATAEIMQLTGSQFTNNTALLGISQRSRFSRGNPRPHGTLPG